LQFRDLGVLVFGPHLGEHLVDPQRRGDLVGHLLGIAGDHGDADAEAVQFGDRVVRFGTHRIFECQRGDNEITLHDVEHGCAAECPPIDIGL